MTEYPTFKRLFPEAANKNIELLYADKDIDAVKEKIKTRMCQMQYAMKPKAYNKLNLYEKDGTGTGYHMSDLLYNLYYTDEPIVIDIETTSFPDTGECIKYAGTICIGNPVNQPVQGDGDISDLNRNGPRQERRLKHTLCILYRTTEQLNEILSVIEECCKEQEAAIDCKRVFNSVVNSLVDEELDQVNMVNRFYFNKERMDELLVNYSQFIDLDMELISQCFDFESGELKSEEKQSEVLIAVHRLAIDIQNKVKQLSERDRRRCLIHGDVRFAIVKYIMYSHNSVFDMQAIMETGRIPGQYAGEIFTNIKSEDDTPRRDWFRFELEEHQLNREKYSPIVTPFGSLEFRCSMQLAGGRSLEAVSKSFGIPWLRKSHDLDYSLVRTPETPLTKQETKYCFLDVLILAHFIELERQDIELWMKGSTADKKLHIYNIPVTSTNKAKRFVQSNTIKSEKYHEQYADRMRREKYFNLDEYNFIRGEGYRGGFTKSNIRHTNALLKGHCEAYNRSMGRRLIHLDITSSYPTVLCLEEFPVGKPTIYDTMTHEEIMKLIDEGRHCIIAKVMYTELQIRESAPTGYLPDDRAESVNPVKENGRILEADKYTVVLTDREIAYVPKLYEYGSVEYTNVHVFEKDYLPLEFVSAILAIYERKTQLKGVPGDDNQREYAAWKALLNSIYGMCVKRLLMDEYLMTGDGWSKADYGDAEDLRAHFEEVLDKAQGKNMFNSPIWGVFCTAYARDNLWKGIKRAGVDFIYCDTDSIFCFENERIIDFVEHYNNEYIPGMIDAFCRYKTHQTPDIWCELNEDNFDMETYNKLMGMFHAKDKDGAEHVLGTWDYEPDPIAFKTCGSKRYLQLYLDKDGNYIVEATVAGCPKKQLSARFQEVFDSCLADGCDLDKAVDKTFKLFDTGLMLMTKQDADNWKANSGKELPKNWFVYREGEKTKTRPLYLGEMKDGKIRMAIDRDVTDHMGNTTHVTQRYGVCIVPVSYNMTEDESLVNIVETWEQLYTGEGVNGEW